MKHMLEELMKKKGKGGDKLDPQYKDAKMSVLEEIKALCEDRMSGDLGDLKKVTVAAPDSEALKEGLDKAEKMVDKMPDMMGSGEDAEEDADEESELSDEEKAMLEKLLKKQAKTK